MNNIVNVAIQVLPRSSSIHPYEIVDKAIEEIKKSGIKYMVCPFETVLEGEYEEIIKLIKRVQQACYEAGAEDLICNLKIQTSKSSEVTIDSKMAKYK